MARRTTATAVGRSRSGEDTFDYYSLIFNEIGEALAEFAETNGVRHLSTGKVSRSEYQEVLRQLFHVAGMVPQWFAEAIVSFGGPHEMRRRFLIHAGSEIGHELLALNDFMNLGGSEAYVRGQPPLDATKALIAHAHYVIENSGAVGFLGTLMFSDFYLTMAGKAFQENLERCGFSPSAMTYLRDHAEIDIGHNKMLEKYVNSLVKSKESFQHVVYVAKQTGFLYGAMYSSAIEFARTGHQRDLEESPGFSERFDDTKILAFRSSNANIHYTDNNSKSAARTAAPELFEDDNAKPDLTWRGTPRVRRPKGTPTAQISAMVRADLVERFNAFVESMNPPNKGTTLDVAIEEFLEKYEP